MLNQLKLLLSITDTSEDNLLYLLIKLAKDLCINSLHPFDENVGELVLPKRYDYWVVRAAQQMYQMLGQEVVQSYSENGLSITYKDLQSGVSKELLNEIIPKAKAIW